MNAERLLAHYEQIADAPDAISRLRRFILDLAVRGKLVPQDPKDEPAAELLKRITSEKLAQRDLPKAWRRARVGAILDFQYGKGLNANERSNSGPVPVFGSNGIVGYTEKPLTARPSIIVGRKGSAGALNLCDGPSWTTDVAYFVEAPSFIAIRFLLNAFTSMDLDKLGKGVKPGLSRSDAYEQIMCIPPLAEQHRIVAKVDELMGLCDRLETARAKREATRDRLTASSLARLNAPDPETFQCDARFMLNALPALTTRPDQIKQLRQTILNLAVRGKLVPEDEGELIKEVELESLVKIVRGSSPRPKGDPRYYGGPVPRLLIADITRDGKYVTPQIDNLTIEGAKLSRPMSKGSLVLAISGSYGVPAFLAVDACIHDGFIGFRDVSQLVDPQYLYLVMQFRRPYFDDVVKDSGLKNLTTEHLKRLTVPLYPIAVQRRIVVKVDELMAMCDQLEASLTDTAATRRRLLDALLAEALQPTEAWEVEAVA